MRRRAYRFACWQQFPGLPKYHIHLWIPGWLFWLGWLLERMVTVTVILEDEIEGKD